MSDTLCERCGRPKLGRLDIVRWLSKAEMRDCCWRGEVTRACLPPEWEAADAETLREKLVGLMAEIAELCCEESADLNSGTWEQSWLDCADCRALSKSPGPPPRRCPKHRGAI